MQWRILSTQIPQTQVELQKILLQNRGLKTKAQQTEFLHPQPPAELTLKSVGLSAEAVKKAVDRLQKAIQNQEKVLIFGDYDVDGITATAIAWEGLKAAGLVTRPFIPHRLKHGYGLSLKALDEILAEFQPDLILTVDNGIVAHPALERLQELKIPVIVTDHHQPDEVDLPTVATVHSSQLCGAGVAWFLVRELLIATTQVQADQWLDLVALATVADQMPLLGANRDLVTAGLAELRLTQRPGIKALLGAASLSADALTSENLSFGLIPRLNAMGRLKDGVESLRLLCTHSTSRATELAQRLQTTNAARQDLTQDLLKQAELQAQEQLDQRILVVYSTEFHEGVIGLLAGKLMEQYSRPVVAIQVSQNLAKASVRSVPGVNIIELLRELRESFWELGGHALAAGFACDPAQVTQIQQQLFDLGQQKISADQLIPTFTAECELPTHWLSLDFYDWLQQFEPFGQSNSRPIFQLKNLKLIKFSLMGKQQQHLRLTFELTETGRIFEAVAWQKGSLTTSLVLGQQLSVLANLTQNVWRERKSLQLQIIDWKIQDTKTPTG